MKVALFSNFLNHHQLPFCLAMCRLTDNQFTFVATEAIPNERLNIGYHDMNKQYPFVLTTYDSKQNEAEAMRLALESDVIITGSAPEVYSQVRIKKNCLTFRYSERIYKRGRWRALSPRGFFKTMKNHTQYRNRPLYMLCASAYTASDFSLLGAYIKKAYKWGYFPEVKRYDDIEQLIKAKKPAFLLWAGRLIGWKHPDASIHIAKRLQDEGIPFDLNIIGSGEMEDQLKELIKVNHLEECVHLLGSMKPDQVRKYMETAEIFLFTSDYNEGWGAVLNEAMNSGCAVVASHAIGSVPFLIAHNVNGMIYRNGDLNDLHLKVRNLLVHETLRQKLGENAYETMSKTWNAEVAAERLIALSEELLKHGQCDLFEDGPCSRAEVLKNDWFCLR